MKKTNRAISFLLLVTIILTVLPVSGFAADEEVVAINAANFPDSTFRSAVSAYDADGDAYLSESEIKKIKDIDISNKNVMTIKGVEYLTSLITFNYSGNPCSEFNTSANSSRNLKLSFDREELTISGYMFYDGLREVGAFQIVSGESGYQSQFIDYEDGVESGTYFSKVLDFSGMDVSKGKSFWVGAGYEDGAYIYFGMYLYEYLYVECYGNSECGYFFMLVPSAILDYNADSGFLSLNPNRYRGYPLTNHWYYSGTMETAYYSSDLDSDKYSQIKAITDEIVADCSSDYEKVYCIHMWCANNLYYDNDYLNGKTTSTYMDPIDVYNYRYTVCEGYTRLMLAMLCTQGIPCVRLDVFSSNTRFNEGDESVNSTTSSNHTHPMAYADGRWIICDPTWDSGNTYENGVKTDGYTTDYYFDISPEAYALSHKVIEVYPASVTYVLGDTDGDNIVNASDLQRLRNYLANYDYSKGESDVIVLGGADANDDGVINLKDLIELRKILANQDDESGSNSSEDNGLFGYEIHIMLSESPDSCTQ